MQYDHKKIEEKWQKHWARKKTYETSDKAHTEGGEKCYVLDMFPYPSGEGLHVGHPKGYIATDIYSRFQRMNGKHVLHPMGWDAFGLPAENFAIKNKTHPRIQVEKNIERFKEQLSVIGLDYDWSREINTTDPAFYKWTQWIFLKMFEKGLAFESHEPINWCPSCQTGLANEDLENGKCERCGSEVEKRPIRQWVLKITDYAERLLADLDGLNWPNSIKESQRHWIGKSEGAEIDFEISAGGQKVGGAITVFTTRPDTLFGVTYVVLAPEHKLVQKLKTHILNWGEVENYIAAARAKTDIDRTAENREKTGVELKGITARHPATGEEVPVWIADYVLASYGTGAVMAVPAHDERDAQFAATYALPVKQIDIAPDAAEKNTAQWGRKVTKYKLRDWVFSRQRYWGEPIPLIHCEKCGVVAVPEKDLPVKLPEVEHYEPTGTGESPLAAIETWVNVKCPKCRGAAKRETNTMPQWAGSSWYYLRYIDPKNKKALVDPTKEKFWSPVDMYVGGAEHATRHLIYARFWHKFLYDIGVVAHPEPFMRLQNVGLILAEDGRKMSKRFGNVVNPDDIVHTYGADTLRVYEMFMGPFNQAIAWDTKSIIGARRFVERVWRIGTKNTSLETPSPTLETTLHKTIKKVTEDIEAFAFNTAISSLMMLSHDLESLETVPQPVVETFIKLCAPFMPHVAEELWNVMGGKGSIHTASWPAFDSQKVVESTVTVIIQVNGKVRDEISVPVNSSESEVVSLARERESVKKWLNGAAPKKVIFVPNRLLNLVV